MKCLYLIKWKLGGCCSCKNSLWLRLVSKTRGRKTVYPVQSTHATKTDLCNKYSITYQLGHFNLYTIELGLVRCNVCGMRPNGHGPCGRCVWRYCSSSITMSIWAENNHNKQAIGTFTNTTTEHECCSLKEDVRKYRKWSCALAGGCREATGRPPHITATRKRGC